MIDNSIEIKLQNSAINLLTYADDIVLKRLSERLNDAAQKVGFQINEQKTEYMIIRRRNTMDCTLKVILDLRKVILSNILDQYSD